jgi:protein SCO1/2
MVVPRIVRILLAVAIGLLIAALIAYWSVSRELQERQAERSTASAGVALPDGITIGGPFTLTDHTGAAVTDQTYVGKYRLVFFGFTYCPDICPTELQVIAAAMDELGAAAERVQPLFISIDPERDTPAMLAQYVSLFDSRITGLTGTTDQIAGVARAYRAFYAKAPGGDAATYLMDHSTYTYLMGPAGEFLTVFPRGTTPTQMAEAMAKFMAAAG